ncbi:chromosome partitioning protein ParA [Pseudomonas asuensis]|nr:chromosome partitioning protein ParA [Pseudomonas asuensis]
MNTLNQAQRAEAVLFFDEEGSVIKEMLYHEFEALLDAFFALPQFAQQRVQLAYVTIDLQLCIRSCVFFYLDFTSTGAADPNWNIPLREMAERAGRGPDLGAGPIRLACRSQCPISWHQPSLWDPALVSGRNDLIELRECIKRNQLGLARTEAVVDQVKPEQLHMAEEHQWYVQEPSVSAVHVDLAALEQEHQAKMEHLVRQQRLRILALTRKHEEELVQLKRETEQLQTALTEQERMNATLMTRLEQEASQYRLTRNELTQQLRALEKNSEYKIEAFKIQFDAEQQARIESAVADYKEQLAIREVELAYREELDSQLEDEIEQLKVKCARLEAESGSKLLERMAGSGVIFVTYQPGAGHITLSRTDVLQFIESPLAYIAMRCRVTQPHYEQWLSHYKHPVCQRTLPGGKPCNTPLQRVESPRQFIRGESDCCLPHQTTIFLKNQAG